MFILLEERDGDPLYVQIYRQIKEMIAAGQLRPGERLPSTRALAATLAVGRNTVENAYAQLVVEGYVSSRQGSGYEVQPLVELGPCPPPAPAERREAPPPPLGERVRIDFQYGQLDPRDFPLGLWRRWTAQALDELRPEELVGYSSGKGAYGLRREVARYLRRSRGVVCAPEQVLICAGTTYALSLLGQMLRPRWGRVAMEDPGYPNAKEVFAKCGLGLLPIPVEEDGLCVDALAASGAGAVYTTPSHQFPGGAVLSIQKRHQLLNWARQTGGIVIEDDYDSEFRYHGRPIPSIASLSPGDNVVYMGTLSKILSPGLRVSYMVLPPLLNEVYDRGFAEYPASVSILEQKVLERFLGSERWEAHLRRVCTANRKKHDLLVRCLKEELGGRFAVQGENAGLHLLVRSLEGRGEEALIRRALARQVRVYPVSRYWTERARYGGDTVLLGFAGLSEGEICEGVRLLGEAWGEEG